MPQAAPSWLNVVTPLLPNERSIEPSEFSRATANRSCETSAVPPSRIFPSGWTAIAFAIAAAPIGTVATP